jgi:hypothetical protein
MEVGEMNCYECKKECAQAELVEVDYINEDLTTATHFVCDACMLDAEDEYEAQVEELRRDWDKDGDM